MLPSRDRMALMLQQRLGPNEVMKLLLSKLAQKIEHAASQGKGKVEFYVPETILGFPVYDRQFVLEEITQVLRNNDYDVTETYAFNLLVSFELRAHERYYCPSPRISIP